MTLFEKARRRAWAVREFVRVWVRRNFNDANTRRFIEFNQRKFVRDWPADENSVVLIEQYETKPALFCFALVANFLARRTGSVIETFTFKPHNPATRKIYQSFGANLGVSLETSKPHWEELDRQASALFAGLTSKWDLINLAVDDIVIGDLIYDHYLRYEYRATVDIRDPALREDILDALKIFRACQEYFARKKVVAVVPDHTRYLKCGIIVRYATLKQVPVYLVEYRPRFYLFALESALPERVPGSGRLQTYQQGHPKRRWPYHSYHQLFAQLTPEQQEAGRVKARKALHERLAGKVDNVILDGISAFGKTGAARVFPLGNKPRVLLLLNDFVDAVHKFRDMLFPDYYDYANFVLEHASRTDFAWFAKPHPNSLISARKNRFNKKIVEELKARYPQITFLEPGVSNSQMVDEGIAAVFTAHGTAGHEFAYLGVPVINAGDNLHVAYDFNLHAKTLEEFTRYVETAGVLKHPIDPREVEEFFYMHNFYFLEKHLADVNPLREELLTAPDYVERSLRTSVFAEMVEGFDADRERQMEQYLDRFFSTYAPARTKDLVLQD